MIGYQVYGDWNGDGIWDIQQDISSIPGALAAWTYVVLLVEAGINPFTGEIFDHVANQIFEGLLEDPDREYTIFFGVTGEAEVIWDPTDNPNAWPDGSAPVSPHLPTITPAR